MSSDLERFIMTYSVEVKGAADRLDSLHEKLSGTGATLSQSKTHALNFAAKASGELGKLVPGIQGIGTVIKALAVEAGIATAALAVIAYGVKAANDLREQHARQRQAGMELGVSGVRIEEYQRKFVNHSSGYVDRGQALEGLRNFQARAYAAYTDPSRLGADSRVMKMLGINVGERGAAPNDLNSELVQLATGLRGKSQGQLQGIAQVLGVQQDWLLTVQRLGPSIGKITEMTAAEVDAYQAADQACARFQSEMAKLKEQYTELEQAAAPLLAPLTKLVEAMEKSIDFMFPKDPVKQAKIKVLNDIAPDNPILSFIQSAIGLIRRGRSGNTLSADLKRLMRGRKAIEQETIGEPDKRDSAVSKFDEVNKRGIQLAQMNAATIQQFTGAIQSFSSAIDISAAWAAWAGGAVTDYLHGMKPGEVKSNASPSAAGASGSGTARGISNNNPGNLEYGTFAIANGATGSDGRFAIFPSMEKGVAAHERLLKDAYIGRGLDTPRKIIAKYAPAIENDRGAYLSFLAARGFDPDARIKDVSTFARVQEMFESGYNASTSPSPAAVATVARNTAQVQASLNGAVTVPNAGVTFSKLARQSQGLAAAREFVAKSQSAKPPVTLENLPPVTFDINAHGKDARAVSGELIERLMGHIKPVLAATN